MRYMLVKLLDRVPWTEPTGKTLFFHKGENLLVHWSFPHRYGLFKRKEHRVVIKFKVKEYGFQYQQILKHIKTYIDITNYDYPGNLILDAIGFKLGYMKKLYDKDGVMTEVCSGIGNRVHYSIVEENKEPWVKLVYYISFGMEDLCYPGIPYDAIWLGGEFRSLPNIKFKSEQERKGFKPYFNLVFHQVGLTSPVDVVEIPFQVSEESIVDCYEICKKHKEDLKK